ncbi:type II toxin-antitoxin system RelE family toxin [Brevibacillus daliensis]|uniref:type II toxin-antitoxin system RelE family toxin n=1 Tax=Brevibacillus daliensis TaxID=2892995 RepID=UPI001E62AB11|nr:type II toxin-antitoxin system RelE/ParE family toxin [Brevibacillus daliensis]
MNLEYRLVVSRRAIKYLSTQERSVRERIGLGMEGLLEVPPEGDIKTMKGYTGLYRLRVGTFRILFYVDHEEKVVYVESIGSRGDVYK